MTDRHTLAKQPIASRILHTMFRVQNLERSVQFYINVLGMHEFRRETYTQGRFTLVFLGYGSEQHQPALELTYNWDQQVYQQGTYYGHIALEVADIYAVCARLAKQGVTILRDPGPMNHTDDEGHRDSIAFIEDPDGYKIELIQA